jgi:hypothetical protein
MDSTDTPSNWPSFLFWLLTHPLVWLTLILVVVLIYLVLRKSGYDPLPPLLAKFGINTVGKATDVSGKWKYRCTAIGIERQWGGTCEIAQATTPYGVEWKLTGHRRWGRDANHVIKTLEPPFYWETVWGAITDKNTVRFTYSIATKSGNVEGYAYGDIKAEGGLPKAIDGKFYQLPPFEPEHGVIEFRRMANDGDTLWN